MNEIQIYNENCITGASKLKDNSVDLLFCDPPFGIQETGFGAQYKRKSEKILEGYVEAPDNYYQFSYQWLSEGVRVLKDNGSIYIVSGWTNLKDILNVADAFELELINQISLETTFPPYTKNKWSSSHYVVLYYKKSKKANPTFNTFCRFGQQEKDINGRSLLARDMKDTWVFSKENDTSKNKNSNKLPSAMLEKVILYSSNVGDVVCDFFQGSFTTAHKAKELGRIPVGFELNTAAYKEGMKKLSEIQSGELLPKLKVVVNIEPKKQGDAWTEELKQELWERYLLLIDKENGDGLTKKAANKVLQEEFGRGYWGIQHKLDEMRDRKLQKTY